MDKCDPGEKGPKGPPGTKEIKADLQYEEVRGDLVTNNVSSVMVFVDAEKRRFGVRSPDGQPGDYYLDLDLVKDLLK